MSETKQPLATQVALMRQDFDSHKEADKSIHERVEGKIDKLNARAFQVLLAICAWLAIQVFGYATQHQPVQGLSFSDKLALAFHYEGSRYALAQRH